MSFQIETLVRRCPRTGRIAGIRRDAAFPRVLLPLLGLLAIAWFLLRVIPKPSRAAYPCQRIAAGLGTALLAHLVTLTAALAGAPPSKTKYDPENNGKTLQSLGVHEHWNSAAAKKYSRNLGRPQGIELLELR